MNAREYLEAVSDEIRTLRRIDAEIDECHRKAGEAPGMSYGEDRVQKQASLEAPFVRWIYKAIELEESAQIHIDRLESMKRRTADIINRLPDAKLRRVLFERYVLAKTWKEVGDSMGYSRSHVFRLHDEAMAEVEGMDMEC